MGLNGSHLDKNGFFLNLEKIVGIAIGGAIIGFALAGWLGAIVLSITSALFSSLFDLRKND